jgi:hypothetical protein
MHLSFVLLNSSLHFRALLSLQKAFGDQQSYLWPKFHASFAHVSLFIEKAGSPNVARVGPNEMINPDIRILFADHSNKKADAVQQMVNMVRSIRLKMQVETDIPCS